MARVKASVVFLVFAGHFLTCCNCREVCVAPDCDNEKSPSSCKTLNKFCVDPHQVASGRIVTLLGGTHWLNTTCEIEDIEDGLTLRGDGGSRPIVACSPLQNSGFKFQNVSNLNIAGIDFTDCGSTWNIMLSSLVAHYQTQAALLFVNGSDLTLTNVTVSHAKSAGIYICNVAGIVTVDSCRVDNGSSGAFDNSSGNIALYDHNKTTSLRITNSQFINNGDKLNYSKGYSSEDDGTFIYSNGLVLFLGTPHVTVSVIGSNFSQNTGCNGGNLAVLFFNFTSVNISGCTFAEGWACSGGGLYVSFQNSFLDQTYHHSPSYSHSRESLHVVNSNFVKNHAEFAGGGVYICWKQSLLLNGSSKMQVENSQFIGNSLGLQGRGGLAFHYNTYLDTAIHSGSFPKFDVDLYVSNCHFFGHYLNETSSELRSESSVVLFENVELAISGITVESNTCTAILAIGSRLIFNKTTTVRNNTALIGAGIRICSNSILYLTKHSTLIVSNNSASETGGGVQVETSCLISRPSCFFQYSRDISRDSDLKTVNLTVTNNHAVKGGSNIYGGELDDCFFLYVNEEKNYKYRSPLRVPNNTLTQPSSISSDPQQVCFNHSKELHGELTCNSTITGILHIFPGQKVTLPIRVVGQYFGSVGGRVKALMSEGGAIRDNESVQTVGITGENVSYYYILE